MQGRIDSLTGSIGRHHASQVGRCMLPLASLPSSHLLLSLRCCGHVRSHEHGMQECECKDSQIARLDASAGMQRAHQVGRGAHFVTHFATAIVTAAITSVCHMHALGAVVTV